MTFEANEVSLDSGRPTRNYEFVRGPIRMMYTTADRDVTFNSKTFQGNSGITDDGMQFSGEPVADTLNITVPAQSEIALTFRGIAPADKVGLIVWDWHYQDSTWAVSWVGIVKGVRWINDYQAEVSCQSITTALEAPGLRMGWMRACPHTLYGPGCNVNKGAYRVDGEIAYVDGIYVHVLAAASYLYGWFAGGIIEWEIQSGVLERRGIRAHTAYGLAILGSAYGLSVGQEVRIYPGCTRTISVCSGKFANSDNYGGVPHLPGRSPFDGNPVW